MKVVTWNVNGIRAREAQVLEWVESQRPDVVCLQEIKASSEQVPDALCALAGYWCLWHGHKGYSGVGLHLARATFPARPRFLHPAFDHETRIAVAEVGDLAFASVYVPNGGKDYPAKVRFLEAFADWVAAEHAAGKRLVVCGDLNVAREPRDVHPRLRNPEQIGQTPAEQALLARILGHGLVDLSRVFEPDNDELFSWWAPWRQMRERNMGWRLDYVLVSSALAESARSCSVERLYGTSNHGPVTAVLELAAPAGAAAPPEPEPSPRGQLPLFG